MNLCTLSVKPGDAPASVTAWSMTGYGVGRVVGGGRRRGKHVGQRG